MRNKGEKSETQTSKPRPGPVSTVPLTREIVIPPPQVRVIQVDKPQAQNRIATQAMFMSENPQKIYNPLDYQYPPYGNQSPYANQPIYSQPSRRPMSSVQYVGALEPAGQYQNGAPTQL